MALALGFISATTQDFSEHRSSFDLSEFETCPALISLAFLLMVGEALLLCHLLREQRGLDALD